MPLFTRLLPSRALVLSLQPRRKFFSSFKKDNAHELDELDEFDVGALDELDAHELGELGELDELDAHELDAHELDAHELEHFKHARDNPFVDVRYGTHIHIMGTKHDEYRAAAHTENLIMELKPSIVAVEQPYNADLLTYFTLMRNLYNGLPVEPEKLREALKGRTTIGCGSYAVSSDDIERYRKEGALGQEFVKAAFAGKEIKARVTGIDCDEQTRSKAMDGFFIRMFFCNIRIRREFQSKTGLLPESELTPILTRIRHDIYKKQGFEAHTVRDPFMADNLWRLSEEVNTRQHLSNHTGYGNIFSFVPADRGMPKKIVAVVGRNHVPILEDLLREKNKVAVDRGQVNVTAPPPPPDLCNETRLAEIAKYQKKKLRSEKISKITKFR